MNRHPKRIYLGHIDGEERWSTSSYGMGSPRLYRQISRLRTSAGCIWLAPDCGTCYEERTWCADDAWTECEEIHCHAKSVCYTPEVA